MSENNELYCVIFAKDMMLSFGDIVCELSNVTYNTAHKYVMDAVTRLRAKGHLINCSEMTEMDTGSYIRILTRDGISGTYFITLQMGNERYIGVDLNHENI